MLMKHPTRDEELARLIKLAANYKMSREEMAAQRKSFVKGQIMLSNDSLTDEKFEEIWKSLEERGLIG